MLWIQNLAEGSEARLSVLAVLAKQQKRNKVCLLHISDPPPGYNAQSPLLLSLLGHMAKNAALGFTHDLR